MSFPASALILWLLALIALPVWIAHDSAAWDLRIYGTALTSLQAGHDPYSDATALQRQHHLQVLAHGGLDTDSTPPYSYVYSPITLPLLSALGRLPRSLLIGMYWIVYVAGVLTAIGLGVALGEPDEKRVLLYCAGVAAFFPGLLANGVVLSGNVAYILYGAVLLTALLGWKRGWWLPFYLAVVLASCVKAPFLSFALLPPLSARKQWLPAAAAATAGLTLFAIQPVLWPVLFRHYLQAIELQFSFNKDFGCAPAGLLSQLLVAHGIAYAPWCYVFYVSYALPLFAALIFFSRAFLRGSVSLRQWAPVLLTGILLLNPRIMEYDVAPLTMLLALVAWRYARAQRSRSWIVAMLAAFVVLNAGALYNWALRKALDGPLLVAILLAGMWLLWKATKKGEARSSSPPAGNDVRFDQARAEESTALVSSSFARSA